MRSGITVDDVRADTPCGEAMAALEKAEISIFDRSERALVEMRVNGPASLDAATTYEKKVIEINKDFGPTLPEPIIAVYPQDGTIVPTHPFVILDGAPWVKSEQARAAIVFQQFLLSEDRQSRLVNHGFRPTNATGTLKDPIVRRYGADPQANLAPIEVPDRQVIDEIVKLWEEIRKSP